MEERVYFSVPLPGHRPTLREVRAGTQDRTLEAGAGAGAMEEHCLLACLASVPNTTGAHLPRDGTACNCWTLPTSVINQENALRANLVEAILFPGVSSGRD